jgi:hypothetical protein
MKLLIFYRHPYGYSLDPRVIFLTAGSATAAYGFTRLHAVARDILKQTVCIRPGCPHFKKNMQQLGCFSTQQNMVLSFFFTVDRPKGPRI